jgi:hypothetical protein
MTDIGNVLLDVLTAKDGTRARSTQKRLGPSEVGGCRRRTFYKLNDQPKTNSTLRLSAIMGTAIHKTIEEAFYRQDPFGEKYVLEMEVEHNGLMGHIDLYMPLEKELVDWKTTKLKNLKTFPSHEQKMQVNLYGYLLRNNGYELETVTLVGIPRDGDERQVVVWSQPYDDAIAQEGLEWLKELENTTEMPAPEKYAAFCALYCDFYDATGDIGCRAIKK